MNSRLLTASLFALALTCTALAADTPQFRGPHRDGIFAETGLLKAWPEGGPALAWQADGVGKGYSSMSVVNGTVYTAGMADDGQGYLFAFDLAGKLKFKALYGPEAVEEKMAPGSRSTPTIDGDKIYLESGLGAVYCMALADGKVLWTVDVAKDYKAKNTIWAFSESLLVDGNLVYATPGGDDASVVALNKNTGAVEWVSTAVKEASAYGSPAIFTFGGKRTLVQWLAETLVGLDATTGDLLWSFHQKVPYSIHANTPVVSGNLLYYVAETGGGVLEVGPDGKSVTSKWTAKDPEVLHHGVILKDGYLYAASFQKARKLYCLELATGKEMWSTDEIGESSIVYADGMLYCYESPKKGLVHLVKADPKKYERTGTLQIPQAKDKHWAHPVIADGKLFVRYNGTLYAYNIAATVKNVK